MIKKNFLLKKMVKLFEIPSKNDALFNPDLKFSTEKTPSGISLTVIRDDYLIGGTKQRALYLLLEKYIKLGYNEFIYAGPATGYAQVALAYTASILNVKATIFILGKQRTRLTNLAEKYGAKLKFIAGNLIETQEEARRYSDEGIESNEPGGTERKRLLLPFGMDSEEYRKLLLKQLKKVWSKTKLPDPPRVWLTFGSGTLLHVLAELWPSTEFMPVRVGKNIWEDQFPSEMWTRFGGKERIDFLRVTPDDKLKEVKGHYYQKFNEEAPILPPYNSLDTYDAKVWQRVIKYAKEGDYIWNVAGDPEF